MGNFYSLFLTYNKINLFHKRNILVVDPNLKNDLSNINDGIIFYLNMLKQKYE